MLVKPTIAGGQYVALLCEVLACELLAHEPTITPTFLAKSDHA
jgi:hypothetical protein